MRFWSHMIRGIVCAACVMLAACVDVDEEYWLHGNGAGRAEIHYQLPSPAVKLYGGEEKIRGKLHRFFTANAAFRDVRYQVLTEKEVTRVDVSFAFDSVLELRDLADKPSSGELPGMARSLLGSVDVDLRGRTLDFRREIDVSRAVPQAIFLPVSQQRQHQLSYTIHLPVAAGASNATEVSDGGRTLVWKVPLDQALQGPFATEVTLQVPLPWLLVAGTAVPLSFGCVWFAARQWRRKRRANVIAGVNCSAVP